MNGTQQMNLGTALVLGGVMFVFDLAGFIPIIGFMFGIAGFLTLKMYAYTSGVPIPIGISAFFLKLAWPLSIFPVLTLAVIRGYMRSSSGGAALQQAGPFAFIGRLTGRGSRLAGAGIEQTTRGAGRAIRAGSTALGGAVSAIPYVGAPLGAVIRTGGAAAGATVETTGKTAKKTTSAAGNAMQGATQPAQTSRKPELQKPGV